MPKRIIHNLDDLEQFAFQIARKAKSGDVIGLVGELGAGKTTFVQYLAKALGVKERVNSPTFLVLRIYNANTTNYYPNTAKTKHQKTRISNIEYRISRLVHIDAYRLKSGEDLEALGAMEYIGAPDSITVIEWADRVRVALPESTVWIRFSHGATEGERIVRW